MAADQRTEIESAVQRRAELLHRADSRLLLAYVGILILCVFTAWFFKHHRLRFVHESGLALLYGLVFGYIIQYVDIGVGEPQILDVVRRNPADNVSQPPDFLRFAMSDGKSPVAFFYELPEGSYSQRIQRHTAQGYSGKRSFSSEVLFNILLPPILFNAGYSLKKKNFFRNIGTIMGMVFFGTTISALVIGVLMYVFSFIFRMGFTFHELLYFGSYISATDPVTVLSIFSELDVEPDLFAIVFGESAMNDAVAIVLSTTVEAFSYSSDGLFLHAFILSFGDFARVFFGSLLLGSAIGCATALLTKFTLISDHPLLETAFFVLLSYSSFLLAEAVSLTGIVAVLFCGICQAHYTYNNLSTAGRQRTKDVFESVSFLSESFIFCCIGVSIFGGNTQKWSLLFIVCALITLAIARCCSIYPLCWALNLNRRPPIPDRYQHMIVFAGLRGAMAFALAQRNTSTEARQIMATTTSLVVILTVWINGGLTTTVIRRLGIRCGSVSQTAGTSGQSNRERLVLVTGRTNEDSESSSSVPSANATNSQQQQQQIPMPPAATPGRNPWDKAFLPRKWYNFDARIMKPLLTHATPTLIETLPECCAPLARLLTSERQFAKMRQDVEGPLASPLGADEGQVPDDGALAFEEMPDNVQVRYFKDGSSSMGDAQSKTSSSASAGKQLI